VKLTAWRIFKPRHAASAFTGEGARLYGGRWNSKGTALVYTAQSCSLAALEMLVHLQAQQILESYEVAQVVFDSALVTGLQRAKLPHDWRAYPPPLALRALGDQWAARNASAILRVPSAIVEAESNYLLNPAHPDFAKITVGPACPFVFDPRLLKQSTVL
jgi:RES domain-containing protein